MEEFGVSARDDNGVAALVVQSSENPAPLGKALNFVEEEEPRRAVGEALEGGQQRGHVFGGETGQAVILEVDEEDVSPAGVSTLLKIGDELVHQVGLPRSSWTDDGKDAP